MQGVTVAIVGFIFACVVWPNLVKHRPQFHAGLMLVLLIILIDAGAYVAFASGAIRALAYALIAFMQVGAILCLFFSAGGVTPVELLGGVRGAFEVIRRGEEHKEVIIPIGDQKPRPAVTPKPRDNDDDEGKIVFEINDPNKDR